MARRKSTVPQEFLSQVLTTRDVAEILEISMLKAQQLITRGMLPGFKIGWAWHVWRPDLEEWIEEEIAAGEEELNQTKQKAL